MTNFFMSMSSVFYVSMLIYIVLAFICWFIFREPKTLKYYLAGFIFILGSLLAYNIATNPLLMPKHSIERNAGDIPNVLND